MLGLKLDLIDKKHCFYGVKVVNIVIGRWILGSKLDLGPKVGSDKVGLGPKVGSDREEPWFLWSQNGKYSDRKVDLGLKVGSWPQGWI